jgi:hypothetical protein
LTLTAKDEDIHWLGDEQVARDVAGNTAMDFNLYNLRNKVKGPTVLIPQLGQIILSIDAEILE